MKNLKNIIFVLFVSFWATSLYPTKDREGKSPTYTIIRIGENGKHIEKYLVDKIEFKQGYVRFKNEENMIWAGLCNHIVIEN